MSTDFKYFDLTNRLGWEKALKNLVGYPSGVFRTSRIESELENAPQMVDKKLGVLRDMVQQAMDQAENAVFRGPEHKRVDRLAAVGALLVLRYSIDEELFRWGYQTAQKALRYIPRHDRRNRKQYSMEVARAISRKDNPELFKSWLTYCGMDMLEPYIEACLMGSNKILEAFAPKQAKRYSNMAIEVAIWEASPAMFEALLPHTKPKKGNSNILAVAVKRAGIFRREIEALERFTSIPKDHLEKQKRKYNFVVQVIERLIPLCDPFIVIKLNSSHNTNVEDLGQILLPRLNEKHLDKLVKYKSLVQAYPVIKLWETRKKLMQKARISEKPKPARPSM